MLFDYLAGVDERHKEKIHEGGYESVFVGEYLIRSSSLSLLSQGVLDTHSN